jgi:enoyl-CoA hydratase
MGRAIRLVERGEALGAAVELGRQLAAFPQRCLRADRTSSYEQWGLSMDAALQNEYRIGKAVIDSGETVEGATRFAQGEGRHGAFPS